MAISKKVPTDFGVDAEYHVLSYLVNKVDNTLFVKVDSWLDKTARDANAKPLREVGFILVDPEVWAEAYAAGGDMSALLNEFITSTEEFYTFGGEKA